jgi:hypothetical protein
MRNERRTSGSGKGAAETCAGNRASAPRPHFHWRRFKRFWKHQFAAGHDPGMTFDRDSVDVAVRLTSPSEALDEEMRLIARLKPRDNITGQPEHADEEAPF